MAERLVAHVVSDLCLGKPSLRSLSVTATIAEALSALKSSEDSFISVWSCSHGGALSEEEECQCVGKICMVDVICYLSREENLLSPSLALKSPLSLLLPEAPGLVVHIEPSSSLLEAIDLFLKGAQNLVVPIKTRRRVGHQQQKLLQTIHGGREYCWLTLEDMMRFLLSSIGLFSPIPALSIESLDIISTDIMTIDYHSPASEAIGPISRSLSNQTSVAVIDPEGILIGEISPSTLACCDETVAAAVITLSTVDLMAYIDCGGPPEDLVKVVKERLKKRGLERVLEEFSINPSSPNAPLSSSDEESSSGGLIKSGKYSRSLSYSARMVRRAEAIVCNPGSSLVAVMIQAIAHRVNYVWVIEDDCSLVGIITFSDMLKVFRVQLESMA